MGRVNVQNPCYTSFGPEPGPRPLAACGYSMLDRVWFSAMSAKCDSIPDRSTRSQSLYRLSYLAHIYSCICQRDNCTYGGEGKCLQSFWGKHEGIEHLEDLDVNGTKLILENGECEVVVCYTAIGL